MMMKIDKLVINFIKFLNLNSQKLPSISESMDFNQYWLSLGYFDSIQIRPLFINTGEETDNWPQEIWKYNIKLTENLNGQHYIHPFHIMADLSEKDKEEMYQNFWQRKSPCLFISLVQGNSEAFHCQNGNLSHELEKRIEKDIEKISDDISYVFYRTLELSDLVIIWKAKSMQKILEQIQKLLLQSYIGDFYTFCGINRETVCGLANRQGTVSTEFEDSKKLYVEMRFIVKDFRKVQAVLEELNILDPYFVTGIEDIHAIWQNINESDFFEILYHCLFDPNISIYFNQAFREVETHVGIQGILNVQENQATTDSLLTQRCRSLLEFFSQLELSRQNEFTVDYSWIKSVRSQLNQMVDMSQNPVVNGLCYLVLDSVSEFVSEIRDLVEKQQLITSMQLARIQRFVRGWGILLEQASRADGRFALLPGLSTPLYDIPSSLLEFYLAFTKQCVRILQSGGGERANYAMLIVPKLCRRIKVELILDYQDPPCDRLLYVDVPLDILYDPFVVLCALVHETSHFCGDVWRDRVKRAEFFITICSVELAAATGLFTKDAVKKIENKLKFHLDNSDIGSKGPYLKDLKKAVYTQMEVLINDSDSLMELMKIAQESINFESPWGFHSWKNWCVAQIQRLKGDWSSGPFYQMIDEIYMLFRECYADVSMIRMLDLSMEEYIRLANGEIHIYENWISQGCPATYNGEPDIRGFYTIVQRWTVVCKACFNELSKYKKPEEIHLKVFYEHIIMCDQYIQGKQQAGMEELQEFFCNKDTLAELQQYLMYCCKKMDRLFCNENSISQGRTTQQIVEQVRNQSEEQFQNQMEEQILGSLKELLQDQIEEQDLEWIKEQVQDQIKKQALEQIKEEVRIQIGEQIKKQGKIDEQIQELREAFDNMARRHMVNCDAYTQIINRYERNILNSTI